MCLPGLAILRMFTPLPLTHTRLHIQFTVPGLQEDWPDHQTGEEFCSSVHVPCFLLGIFAMLFCPELLLTAAQRTWKVLNAEGTAHSEHGMGHKCWTNLGPGPHPTRGGQLLGTRLL